ncbi:MAG: PIN domain-containing protein [Verrucomicrobia bacterium]|nr:PIN domain-containing protein [Verrucomicrobiota bacterium]
MAANGPRKQLGLDTNVLFGLADGKDFVHAFREAFQAAGYALRFSPTVLQELVTAELEADPRERQLATTALSKVVGWQIRPFDLTSIEQAITEQLARKLLLARLLPPEEFNDALILAESSVAEIPLLVTADQHLLNMDEDALLLLFNAADLLPVRAAHPRRLLRALG